jgi:DNA-binding transcriptional ArsR family regulator
MDLELAKAHDMLFRTLADPTRRAIFERLCREGEQTVGALTARAGSRSQPKAVKPITARSSAPWPRCSTGRAKWRGSGKAGSMTSKICSNGWTNEQTSLNRRDTPP